MSTATPLVVTAGLPYKRRFRVVGAKAIWPTLAEVEVRAHVRAGRQPTTALLVDLRPYLTLSSDVGIAVNDILGELTMTGQQTRTLVSGYYDVVLSDVGAVDARAVRVLFGEFAVQTLVTGAVDV